MSVLNNEVVRCALTYIAPNASLMQNVFFWQNVGATLTNQQVLDTLEDFFEDVWGAAWQDIAATTAELSSMMCDVIRTDGTVARNLGERSLAITGTEGIDTASAAVSGYFYASTTVPKARGSKYVPAVADSVISNGEFNAGAITNLSLMLVAYLATIDVEGVSDLVPGVLSRPLEAFVAFSAQGLVNSIPAYQRRRKPSVGA